ncbi:MAG: hypothetical protein IKY73_01845 [Bacteroidaceae bacterium]|nr:hypothetical protein [Bacteroidaceae bacterium]
MKRYLLFTLILITTAIGVKAQTITERQELTGALGSGEYAPFWHMANRQGLGSEKRSMGYARVGVGGNHPFSKSGIAIDWDFDMVAGGHMASNVFIQQANIDLTWRELRLSIGQKERWGELMNHRLTTGSLVESGNARPIPQVRLELHDYWNIPGTGGWLALKGHLAYGRFTDGKWMEKNIAPDQKYTIGTLYHSKEGFMRFGNASKFPLTAEIGLHMVTQFGGTSYNAGDKPGYTIYNPSRFKDYFLALIPLKGDDSYHASDQANIAGNVLGSWKGAITWHSDKWVLKLNYDHAFEDHSQMFWEYGLWTEQLVGLELNLKEFKWIKAATVEYFNLKNQSGPVYNDTNATFPDQISCKDDNYNHGRYGWFNYGMMIATPLCTSPIYNKDNTLRCHNNRVEAFHMGIEGGLLPWLDYRILLTHSNNWGTYGKPFKDIKKNTSGLVEFTFTPNIPGNWSIITSFAFDKGNLYGNNYGGLLTIKRSGRYKVERRTRND